MKALLGIDLGTSGTKTVLFDETGHVLASSAAEYPLYQPQNGWAEQDAEDWWNAALTTIQNVVKSGSVSSEDIVGIGLSGQMHGLVLLDENLNVLRKSIIWCDGRTQDECDEITERVGKDRLIAISANPALTGFTAGKILWVRRHEPEIWAKVRHILLPKDYVRLRLTGQLGCEVSDASGTNLLDVPNRCWSKEIMEKLGLDPSLFPKLTESADVAGTITEEIAGVTGLKAGTPVAAGAGDNMAAAIGMGVVTAGKAFTTIGTSGVVFAHSDRVQIDPKGRVHSFCSAVPGAYTVMSCTLAAGLSLKWFRDSFCRAEIAAADEMGVDPYVLMNQEAARSPIGCNRLFFLPYLMGERSPLLDANARGAFIGLSAIHQKHDLIRAVMEGVMYSQRQNLDVLRGMKVVPGEMLACGGGAKSPMWRQMMADIFQMPVKTAVSTEGPALGAAILGGVAGGLYPDVPTACGVMVAENPAQNPETKEYEPFYQLYAELYPLLKGSYAKLAKL